MKRPAPQGRRSALLRRRVKAFTLVEVMVASVLFMLSIGAIMFAMLACFRLTVQTRYEDRAAAVLKTLADQFQNGSCRLSDGKTLKVYFQETGDVKTGEGMAWSAKMRTFLFSESAKTTVTPPEVPDTVGDATNGLIVSLGTIGVNSVGNSVNATITRQVRYIDPSTGAPYTATPASPPPTGFLAKATFRAQFMFRGHLFTSSTTALRNLNPSDR